MEALEALQDALHVPAREVKSEPDHEHHSASGSPGDPLGGPRRKRRRTLRASFDAAEAARGEVSDRTQDNMTVMNPAAAAACTEDKECFGCFRLFLSGKNYCNPQEFMQWVSGGRGKFCLDCFTVWRTCYSNDHTSLPLFQTWLQTPAHQQEFEYHLVAYLSLVKAEVVKITAALVIERVGCLKFMMRLMFGTPDINLAVVPLADAVKLPGIAPNPSSLITISSTDGDELGMLVPSCLVGGRAGASTFKRPLVEGFAPPLPTRRLLSSSSVHDNDHLASLFAGSSALVAAAVKAEQHDHDSAPTKSRLEHKLESILVEPATLLKIFSSEAWSEVKESALTSCLTKLHGINDSATSASNKVVIERAETWIIGLGAGKQFVRQYRDYNKSKQKHQKLMECLGPLTKFKTFLEDQLSVQVSPSLGLLFHKMMFHSQCSEHAQRARTAVISDPLRDLFDGGFVDVMKAAISPDTGGGGRQTVPDTSPDAWLRAVVFTELARLFRTFGSDKDQLADLPKQVLDDLRCCCDLLNRCADDLSPLGALIADLEHLVVIFGACVDPPAVVATSLRAALQHAETLRMKGILSALRECEMGGRVLAKATCLLQESSKDGVADEKIQLAIKQLEDKRLPGLVRTEAEGTVHATVSNFHLLSGMAVVDTLEESLQNVAEACEICSPIALERKSGAINDWLMKIIGCLTFYDGCLATYAQALTSGGAFGQLLWQARATVDPEEMAQEEMRSFSALASLLDSHGDLDDTKLCDFYTRLADFVARGLPQSIRPTVDITQVSSVVATLRENANARCMVEQALDLLSAAPGASLMDPAEMLEEWRAKKKRQSEDTSFIAHALAVSVHFGGLETIALQLDGQGGAGDMTVRLAGQDGADELVGHRSLAQVLPSALCQLEYPKVVRRKVNGCAQVAVDAFIGSLHLLSLNCHNLLEARPASETSAEWVESLVDQRGMGDDGARLGNKIFACDSKNGYDWPCDSFQFLMQSVVDTIPDGNFEVSLQGFCIPSGGGDVLCTEKGELKSLGLLYAPMARAATTMLYLKQFVGADAEACIRDGKLKTEVDNAAVYLKTAITKDASNFASASSALDIAQGRRLLIAKDTVVKWWASVAMLAPHLLSDIIYKMLEQVVVLIDEVGKLTPKWDHIVTPTKLHVALAKKALLGFSGRAALSCKTILLHKVVADIGRAHTSWALLPKLTEDPVAKPELESANTVLRSATKAIEIIACLSVICELTGAEQSEKAGTILAKYPEENAAKSPASNPDETAGPPSVLRKELQKIVGKSLPAKASGRKVR